jgi:RNA polymerase subunit RPABC4/transcription elongation factor Spt4
MTTSNQTSSRFKDELRILSPWAYALAALVFVAIPVLFVVFVGKDPKAPPFAARCLLGAIAGTLMACYVILIGYINRDAGRRGMSRVWWTLLAMFVPNGLGIVLYFILRKPRTAHCPQCDARVEPGFSFCPRCRNRLQPVCPHCQRAVDLGDKFCPYCGEALEPTAAAPPAPAPTTQPPLSS